MNPDLEEVIFRILKSVKLETIIVNEFLTKFHFFFESNILPSNITYKSVYCPSMFNIKF